MNLKDLPTGTIDWSKVPESVYTGETGTATIQTQRFGGIQVRFVVYSANYVSNHWCSKGHMAFAMAGQLVIEHQNGVSYAIAPGISYLVAEDDRSPHRGVSKDGATALIID